MQRVAEQQRLLGREEEVGAVGGILPAVRDEDDGPPYGVGDSADQVTAVGRGVGLGMGLRLGLGRSVRRVGGVRLGSGVRCFGMGWLGRSVQGGESGRLGGSPGRRGLASQEGGEGDRVRGRCLVGGVGEVGRAEAVPSRGGPVVDGHDEGCAARGEGDAEGAVVGGGEVVLAYPAAQQVLDGGGLGRGVGVGVFQQVGGGAAQPFGLLGPGLLPGDRFGPRPERGLCAAPSSLVGVGVAVGCGDGVQEASSGVVQVRAATNRGCSGVRWTRAVRG